MRKIFIKNLEALKKTNSFLAQKVESIEENRKYEVFMGDDPVNINIIDTDRNEPLYLTSAVEETLNKLEKLKEKQKYPFLYFFGLGNGIFFKLVFESFESIKRIVVFEPEIEIIYIVLNLIDLSSYIEERKLLIFSSSELTFPLAVDIMVKEEASLYSKLYELDFLSAYYNNYQNEMLEVNSLMTRAIEHIIFSVGNDAVDSLIGLEHHIQNFPFMVKTSPLNKLVKKAKNTETAVLVSTGPSLMKQIPLLKEIQESVTILCIDASFPILYKHGIKPDIVFSLERVEATAGFYEDLPKEAFDDVVFSLTSIVHQKLLNNVKSENIQMSMRPFNYLRYFKNDPWGYIGKGMSAANMAFEFAYYSGFKKVVLIGQDLAFSKEGTSHAKDHTRGVNDVDLSRATVYLEAYGGAGQVRSTAVWKAFLNFFEDDISQTAGEMTAYNATEGGARIHGAIEIPFGEFVERFVDRDFKKKRISIEPCDEKLAKEHEKLFYERVVLMKEKLETIKKECEETFLNVVGFLEDIEELNKKSKVEDIDFQKADLLLEEINHIKEYFDESEFFSMVFEFVRSYIISQELEVAKIQVKHIKNDMDKKVQIIEWLYAHKFWLFSLAGGLDAILVVIERASIPDKEEVMA